MLVPLSTNKHFPQALTMSLRNFFQSHRIKQCRLEYPPQKLHERLWFKHKFLITSIQETSFERLNNGSWQIIWDIKKANLKETSLDLFWPLQWTDECPFSFSKPLIPVLLDWQTSIHKMQKRVDAIIKELQGKETNILLCQNPNKISKL